MISKIKLGFYMYTPEIGGAEQHLRDLLWSLDRRQYDITLFYEPWPVFEQFLGLNDCPPLRRYPIPMYEASLFYHHSPRLPKQIKRLRYFINYYFWQYLWMLPNYRRLRSALATAPVEILHINNGGYPGATTARLASLAARAAGVPACLMTIANIPVSLKFSRWLERPFDHAVGMAVDCFAVVSQEVGRVLTQTYNFPSEKVKTIYYGLNPKQNNLTETDKVAIRHQLGLSTVTPVIGVVARLSPEKGHTYLLEALAQLREHLLGRVEVLLVGGGDLFDLLKTRTVELGLEHVVKFTGPLTNHEVFRAISVCDFMVLPSLYEGLPYAITEAMSLKKSVIATAVGGIPEQIIDDETGLLVPAGDSAALARAIWRLISQPELAQQMGWQAYTRYQTLFTFDRMLQEHEALYQSLYRQKVMTSGVDKLLEDRIN